MPNRTSRAVLGLATFDQLVSSAANAAVFIALLAVLPSSSQALAGLLAIVGQFMGGAARAAISEPLTFLSPANRLAAARKVYWGLGSATFLVLTGGLLAALLALEDGIAYASFLVLYLCVTIVLETWRGILLVLTLPAVALRLDLVWFLVAAALVLAPQAPTAMGACLLVPSALALVAGRPGSSSAPRSCNGCESTPVTMALRLQLLREYLLVALGAGAGAFALGSASSAVSTVVLRSLQIISGPVNTLNMATNAVLPSALRDGGGEMPRRQLPVIGVLVFGYMALAAALVWFFEPFGSEASRDLLTLVPLLCALRLLDSIAAVLGAKWRAAGRNRENEIVKLAGAAITVGLLVLVVINSRGEGEFLAALAVARFAQVALWLWTPLPDKKWPA